MAGKTKKVAGRGRGRPSKASKDEDVNGEDKTLAKPTKTIEKASTGRKRGRPPGSGKKKAGAKKTKATPKKKRETSDEEESGMESHDEPTAAEMNGEEQAEE
ncbi:unnamed protein product [Cylicocyclus nassatus]|uniref:Uncharacterized protein n=1 Tax=Cylicocyclus nassatus TaxID=53992 RepID=A0AA36GQ98_CYLNA|nr:unnamed protein product [Cylicocyclus nassatus]